ncbi:MAG: DNA/RNA nuclease SfsA [Planctomycetes bacterium]|nr:DNA/RNA nuclease SfsA [Planctomycetota bacterium]
MKFTKPILEARLIRRYKRFLVDFELDTGEVLTGTCPNTGSLLGCLQEGARILVRDDASPTRKYRYTWIAIYVGRTLVSIDTAIPNHVVAEAIQRGAVRELAGYDELRKEVAYGRGSRIDIRLQGDRGTCFVEVKSTTLRIENQAQFPDAVSERGRKHLHELMDQVRAGHRAVQFFFVQRGDCEVFRPAWHIDPTYAETLETAVSQGVEVLAWDTRVRRDGIWLRKPLPVEFADWR